MSHYIVAIEVIGYRLGGEALIVSPDPDAFNLPSTRGLMLHKFIYKAILVFEKLF